MGPATLLSGFATSQDLELSPVVNRADIGMVQCGGRFGFTLKAFQGMWIVRQMFRQEFQSDGAAEPVVLGLINHTHPAATKLLDDAVVRDG